MRNQVFFEVGSNGLHEIVFRECSENCETFASIDLNEDDMSEILKNSRPLVDKLNEQIKEIEALKKENRELKKKLKKK